MMTRIRTGGKKQRFDRQELKGQMESLDLY